jgi:ring-1,2-phenylacetyl-CoA epoxidase subunit PaaD
VVTVLATAGALRERAREVAATVTDPEMPMLTLLDLGVLRGVDLENGTVVVTITPTYSGCPAMATMRADLLVALRRAGMADAEVRTVLHPAWSTDWISDAGRRKLADAGIAAPAHVGARAGGPVPLTLNARATSPPCPRCGSTDTVETSHFGSTACTAQHRCRTCLEPFDSVKEL